MKAHGGRCNMHVGNGIIDGGAKWHCCTETDIKDTLTVLMLLEPQGFKQTHMQGKDALQPFNDTHIWQRSLMVLETFRCSRIQLSARLRRHVPHCVISKQTLHIKPTPTVTQTLLNEGRRKDCRNMKIPQEGKEIGTKSLKQSQLELKRER